MVLALAFCEDALGKKAPNFNLQSNRCCRHTAPRFIASSYINGGKHAFEVLGLVILWCLELCPYDFALFVATNT